MSKTYHASCRDCNWLTSPYYHGPTPPYDKIKEAASKHSHVEGHTVDLFIRTVKEDTITYRKGDMV